MTRPIVIGTPAGVRRLTAADLPLRIGTGASADIRVPGRVTDEVAGLVSSLDDRLFLQATGAGGLPLAVNGEPVAATRWLEDGDVVTAGALRMECHFDTAALGLSVAYTDTEYATLPPVEETAGAPGQTISPARARRPPAVTAGPRRWSWLLYGSLAVLAAALLYLFTATAVRVTVVPAGSEISLVGVWLSPGFDGRFLLRSGAYQVRLAAEGYEPQVQSITVGEQSSQEFRFQLRKLPGRLTIAVTPAVALRLAVDGTEIAAGPSGEFRLAAGKRALRITAERYQPFEATVEIEGRDTLQKLSVALKPNWADVTLASQPDGAAIMVGDASLGVTPATVPVIAGTAQLELRKDGFKPWRQTITVTAGQRVELPPVTLQETDGLLSVVTTPPAAAVTIDGRYRGTTPVEIEVAPGHPHQVIVAKTGYETVSRSITVEHRGSASLRLGLEARVGTVRIDSDPADAELFVNGASRGAANQELTLAAVPQHIEVRKAGFAPFITDVTPRPGLPQVIEVRLLTPQQAVLAAIPVTISTKQGLALRLVGPGQFEMGAPRREQGRRPNETERAVRITRRFYIGTREITNREFREYRPQHTSGADTYQELAGSEHPVVMLSWEDAANYCNWLSERESLSKAYTVVDGALRLAAPQTSGYRLPTEAEWEWAGRYNGGGGARRYPWGDQMPPTEKSGNYADEAARGVVANVIAGYDDGFPVTAPVGSFPPSPLGLYDIGGNVAEWVNDYYSVYAGGATGEVTDPLGPPSGQYHVIRGSGWRHSSISELRLAARDFGDKGRLDVGFRIARNVE